MDFDELCEKAKIVSTFAFYKLHEKDISVEDREMWKEIQEVADSNKELRTRVAELENQAKMDLEKLTEAITLGSTQAEEYDHRLSTLLKVSEGMEKALEGVSSDLSLCNTCKGSGNYLGVVGSDEHEGYGLVSCYDDACMARRKAAKALADFRAVKEGK